MYYAVAVNSAGQVWTGTAYEVSDPSHWASYVLTLTSVAPGIYSVADVAGAASYAVYSTSGTPASTDPLITTSPTKGIVTASVTSGGTMNLVRGDDYKIADGRAFIWANNAWNLVGASVLFLAGDMGSTTNYISTAASVVNASSAQLEIDSTDSSAFPVAPNQYSPSPQFRYALVATLADGNVMTLDRGKVQVAGRAGQPTN